ncbi:MAG: NAD-dependent epimerase/dehydratase family protein, partial [Rhizobiaceae bacterium]
MKVLVSGAAGFIAGYLIQELLDTGHEVVGIDNLWKYGEVVRSFDNHAGYRFVEGDVKNVELMKQLLVDCDHFIAGAAIIGGISLFHELAYDLLAENERITAASFDAAIWAHKHHRLQKITVVSSSMVYE